MKISIHVITLLISFTILHTVAASEIVADNAELILVDNGFSFAEGGARDPEGNVYFTDVPNSRIHKWDATTNKVSLFFEESGGANGCWVGSAGQLIICQGANRSLGVVTKSGKLMIMTDEYRRNPLNSPNDLWVNSLGGIYFSDPRYGPKRDDIRQDGENVYYFSPRLNMIQVTDDLVRPNGLVGSLDGKILYIADHGAGKTYAYEIKPNGTLGKKKLLIEEGSDGMTIDERGNLYLTNTAVRIFRPDGSFIEEIVVPNRPSNVCFGGKEGNILFITARDSVYTIETKVKGGTVN